jgi:hypothetical protein
MAKADHPSRGCGNHSGVQFAGKAETPHKEKYPDHNRGGMDRRGNARGPVTDAEDAIAVHHLPEQQGRLFQPGRAVQRRDNPVMPGQHLAGNLRVARLVRAGQPECAKSKKEKEVAHAQNKRELHSQQFVAISHEKQSLVISTWYLALFGRLMCHSAFVASFQPNTKY